MFIPHHITTVIKHKSSTFDIFPLVAEYEVFFLPKWIIGLFLPLLVVSLLSYVFILSTVSFFFWHLQSFSFPCPPLYGTSNFLCSFKVFLKPCHPVYSLSSYLCTHCFQSLIPHHLWALCDWESHGWMDR